ncbi:Glycosyl hydrolases family 16 [Chitinophaga costaii]|uniref:Glycosyl hydrolases family 16 n=1 Tax=Chitinophaga costaii TaxID=1335309 RepID=A0A1C4EZT6_9BACT|nr:glycoside hydrolase family 16 protein [Chitinophaga costaii]PUZ21524.1 glycoside hydrolase family 16 protein [Chitinophaga costaii]SCC48953.1 Glycosyl hydrolases family 16 [Chitinophaga costaii]
MKILCILPLLLFTVAIIACSGQKRDAISSGGNVKPTPPQDKGWTFEPTPVWRDEFDTDGLPDARKWGYDLGGSGWGNHELEDYTSSISNAYVKDGLLHITARKEASNGRDYTSARLVTAHKGDWLYGRFEIKAKLPAGTGSWPAIWMLPTDWAYGSWPKSGEIDIMEQVGYDPNNIHISAHCEKYYFKTNTQQTATKVIPTAITGFHLYRLDWTPTALRGYIDDELVLTVQNEGAGYTVWPFDKRFHLLLNLAIGGDWGGAQGVDDPIFPVTMEVDYVRVYKMTDK